MIGSRRIAARRCVQEQAELKTLPVDSPVTGSTRFWTFLTADGSAVNVYSVPLNTTGSAEALDDIVDRQIREAVAEIKRANAGGHLKPRGAMNKPGEHDRQSKRLSYVGQKRPDARCVHHEDGAQHLLH